MKKRLIILSDLWGKEKSAWLVHYTRILEASFEIKYYDCCALGSVSKSDDTEEKLHKQFVNGGIKKAVEKLVELEKDRVVILAFSVGGTIAWQYGIRSGKIDALICVSSTRLRYETGRPSGQITLYFGDHDTFKPDAAWLSRMHLEFEILPDRGHLLYRESDMAVQISKAVVKNE